MLESALSASRYLRALGYVVMVLGTMGSFTILAMAGAGGIQSSLTLLLGSFTTAGVLIGLCHLIRLLALMLDRETTVAVMGEDDTPERWGPPQNPERFTD